MNLELLRKFIRESLVNGWRHNAHTTNNDPYSYEDYPGIDVNMYADSYGGGYLVSIKCEFDESLSEPQRRFPTEADASAYAREKAEVLHRAHMSIQN